MSALAAVLAERLELAAAHAHALADTEARRIARPEDAALAVVHRHRDLVRALRGTAPASRGCPRAPKRQFLSLCGTERAGIDRGADRRALLDVGRHAHGAWLAPCGSGRPFGADPTSRIDETVPPVTGG